jgi:hypothetical protein
MNRRSFITQGIAGSIFWRGALCQSVSQNKNAGPPTTHPPVMEEDFDDYPSYLRAAFPDPPLTQTVSLAVKSQFMGAIGGHGYDHWHPRQQARVLRGAELFQKVWSSAEFKQKVESIQEMYWKVGPGSTSGKDLYPHLMAQKAITMPTSVHLNVFTRVLGHENAASDSDPGATYLQWGYLDAADPVDLCNTLSHEYTHYAVAGASEDGGHTGPNRGYVSYAIGGLTENLAVGYQSSDDDPTYPPKKPEQ